MTKTARKKAIENLLNLLDILKPLTRKQSTAILELLFTSNWEFTIQEMSEKLDLGYNYTCTLLNNLYKAGFVKKQKDQPFAHANYWMTFYTTNDTAALRLSKVGEIIELIFEDGNQLERRRVKGL